MQQQIQGKPRWSTRVADLRKALGMNQAAFATAAGVSQATVSLWEKGKHRPTPDTFARLAALAPGIDKFFFLEEAGVPKEYFMGGMEKLVPSELIHAADLVVAKATGELVAVAETKNARQVEVVMVPQLADAAAAGNPLTINENDIEAIIPLPSIWLPKNAKLFAVKVHGDSMEPILQDGFIAILDVSRRDPKTLVNRLVAARVRDGVTIKWLRRDGKHFMLVAQHVSPRHQTQILTVDEDWSVVGEVVKWIGEPPPPPREVRKK